MKVNYIVRKYLYHFAQNVENRGLNIWKITNRKVALDSVSDCVHGGDAVGL